jgi:hypothetical protein
MTPFGAGLTGTARGEVAVAPGDAAPDDVVEVPAVGTPDFGLPPVVLSQPASSVTAAEAAVTKVSPLWFIG